MDDKAFEVKEDIWTKVHDLVDQELAKHNLTEEQEFDIRFALTEQFRFWERV